MNQSPIILGIDPGTRYFGAAVLRGSKLIAYGVHELKNGERPYDVIGQARRVVFRYVEQYEPNVVAIEAPYLIASSRGVVLSAIARELHARAEELGLKVFEQVPEVVRKALTANERATKIDVAEALLGQGFDELRALVPKRPSRPALGPKPRDRYWLHMFDALAIAAAVQRGKPDKVAPKPPKRSPRR